MAQIRRLSAMKRFLIGGLHHLGQPLLLAGLLLIPKPSAALSADPCYQQQNTLEINACLQKSYEKSDRVLNDTYQKLLRRLVAHSATDDTDYRRVRQQLIAAQLAWIRYRDNDCRAKLTLFAAGSIRHAVYLGCLLERSEQRTRELRTWILEEGG